MMYVRYLDVNGNVSINCMEKNYAGNIYFNSDLNKYYKETFILILIKINIIKKHLF